MKKLDWLRQQILRDNYHYDPLNVEFHEEAIHFATNKVYGNLFYMIVPSFEGENDTEETYKVLKDYPESLFWHRDNSIYHVDYSYMLIGAKVCWRYCRNLGLFKEPKHLRYFHGFIWSGETGVAIKLGFDCLMVKSIPNEFDDVCQREYNKFTIPFIWKERKKYKSHQDGWGKLGEAYAIAVDAVKDNIMDWLVEHEHGGFRHHAWVKQRTGRFPIR